MDMVFEIMECFFADVSCFQGLLFCPEAASLMLRNFCIYHIDAPGHEVSIRILSSVIVHASFNFIEFTSIFSHLFKRYCSWELM